MICKSELTTIVTDSVRQVAGDQLGEIDGAADLTELGVDSLEFTSIVIEVEDRLSEPLPAEVLDAFGELDRYTLDNVVALLSGTAPGAACACGRCPVGAHA